MASLKQGFSLSVFLFALFFIFNFSGLATAAITQDAPPIDAFFPQNINVGGGAIVPLAKFRLIQSSGSDTLTKVGIRIIASTTMASEISRISLWKESGATPDFQLGQDIYIEGAASTSPATNGALIVLTAASPVFVGTQSTEFFIVASTTGTAGIVNGNGFNIHLQNNYASTSAGGIGTEFLSNKKVILNQSATLKISEVKAGTSANTEDEFIELYNSGEADIDLKLLSLNLHIFSNLGSSTPKAITYYKTVIPAEGYFLITSQTNYSGSVQADAVYSTVSGLTLAPNTGFSIATSGVATAATSSAIDNVGWGTQPARNCENTATIAVACAPGLLQDGSSLERIALGFPDATSTAQSMAQGGQDASKGNGLDRNDNSAEFVIQTSSAPQNSLSPTEFSFGGGGFDDSTLQVIGSFPFNNMVSAPIDIPFVGFDFNKVVATTSLVSGTPTTTISLVTGGGSNLCSSVAYNQFHSNFEPSAKCNLTAQLSPSTSYTFTVTSSVKDLSGNQLDQDSFQNGNQNYTAVFTTGTAGQTFTNVTPPFVMGTSPFPGSQNIPTNLSTISVEFNQSNMDTTTFTSANITLASSGGSVSLSGFSFSTTTGRNVLSITPASLSANTSYTLTIGTGVKSSNGISLPGPFVSVFTTGSQADVTTPQIVGVLPTPGAIITANTNDFIFIFDDNIDVTTATSGAITLAIAGGANLPGTVQYSPISKEGHFIPQNVLPLGQNLVLTIKGGSIKNVSGIILGNDLTRTWIVENANSDITGPSILFANADDFNMAVSFNEAVNTTDATNLSNYGLVVGGSTTTLSALAGHTISYDPTNRTARIMGVRMISGSTFSVTASNIKDISGNLTPQSSFSGTVASFSQSGGFVGPGSFDGNTFGDFKDFSSSGIGFMPPVSIKPQSTFINATTTYTFELPIAKQISAGGSIVITLPSSSDFGICCVVTSLSTNPFIATQNADINGPGPGTIAIQSLTADAGAKTITVVIDTATRSESGDTHDFLKFAVAGMKNPSIPKGIDSSGYVFDIKTKSSAGTLLETLNANPVYITGSGVAGGGATTTVRGTVSGNGGNLQGVTIHLVSPLTGPVDATTDTNGLYQFTNMPVSSQFLTNNFGGGGEYFLFTDSFVNPIATSTGFFGQNFPTPVQATSSSIITRNFSLTATTTAIDFTVKLTASASTFTSTEELDIFAGGPGQFVVKTVTPGTSAYNAATLVVIPIAPANGVWNIGIGPAMPKGGGGGFSGPPPSPNWAMPKPVEVIVSGCPSACSSSINGLSATSNTFNISTADKTIAGILKDGSGNTIASAMVFAFSPAGGTGNSGQTSTGGTFSIKVVAGSYVVGAYVPGVGKSREVSVVVDSSGNVFVDNSSSASTGSSGANPFVLKMVKPSYTITGQVTDGTNAVGNAPVFAYRTDAPGRVDTMTDSSTGNYTLYVDNGTWKVSAFVPGFGPMTEQTVVVSGASQSNKNFAPSSSANFSILSGNIYEDSNSNNAFNSGEGITGARIRVSGTSGINEGVSGSDGSFNIRVPSGTGYSIVDIFHPSYGKIGALKDDGTAIGSINLTSSSTQNIRTPVRNTIRFNFKDSGGGPLLIAKASIGLLATATKQLVQIEVANATTTSLQMATGTRPNFLINMPGVMLSSVTLATDSNDTVLSDGVLIIDNAVEIVKLTVDTSATPVSFVSGTVYSGSESSGNELTDAWIQFVDQTNQVYFGTLSTTSGRYSLRISNGTYQVLASKPGYIGSPITLTVSGTTTQNFTLSPANLTISGNITAGGQSASNAFVRAEKIGGGQAVAQADLSGAYTLKVTSGSWRVFASAEGYASAAYGSNPVSVTSSVSGINIALSTVVSLQSKLATSDTFSDTSAGSFADSTVGVSVSLDSNSLGTSGNNSYLTANETSNIVDTVSVNIVGNKAKDINAYSGGSQVTNLSSGKEASIELTYTVSELNAAGITTGEAAAKLKIVSWSEDKQEWESLSTSNIPKDSSGNVVTLNDSNLTNVSTITYIAAGTHFSDYALSNPTGVSPPSTPTGVTATAGAVGVKEITVSWTASSGAEGYYVYKDTSAGGSFPLLADAGNVTSYVSGGLSLGSTYYYKVSAYKSSGTSESAASESVSATAVNYSGGGIVGGSAPASAPTSIPTSIPTPTTVVTPAPGALPSVPAAIIAKPSPVALQVSPVFIKTLVKGMSNADVRKLQELLAGDKTLYPEGIVSGFFGALTEKAVGRFQEKYGVAVPGGVGYGIVGPKTRAKLQQVFSGVPAAEMAKPSEMALKVSPVFTGSLVRGMSNQDVRRLQELLAGDKTLYPEGIVSGFFGALTEKAVGKFQEKYGVAFSGDAGYGLVGPKTRAKLSEVFGTIQ